jgi:hypothetical protein
VLTLAPGPFERLALERVRFDKPVVITGLGAVVAGVEIYDCAGLTFRGLEVTINARTQTAINVVSCQRVRLEKLHAHGDPGGDKPGLMFRNCGDVQIRCSRFHDLGGAVRLIDCEGVRVASNGFRNLRGDGVQSSGSSKVSITGNRFTDFYPGPGDHPDGLLAEVSNTPWNERHYYLVDIHAPQTTQKNFHVSPFNPIDMHYRWQINPQTKYLTLQLDAWRQSREFSAGMSLSQVTLDSASLLRALLSTPVMTIKIVAGIYWEALKLFIKRAPFYGHPGHRSKHA